TPSPTARPPAATFSLCWCAACRSAFLFHRFRLRSPAMYDIKWIREHPDAFDRGLRRRGLDPLSKRLIALDQKCRAAITMFEQAQARRNAASKEIGDAKKAKDEVKANKLMAEV